MCYWNFIQQQWSGTLWSDSTEWWEDSVGSLDSPEHRVSPQPPVWAPGGRFWTLPNPPAPGGWYAAAGPPLLSPSRRSWCTAAGSRPDLREPHRTTGKTFSTARQGENSVCGRSDFQISCETPICIMCSNRAWYRFPCQDMCCKSLKCEHRLYFVMS